MQNIYSYYRIFLNCTANKFGTKIQTNNYHVVLPSGYDYSYGCSVCKFPSGAEDLIHLVPRYYVSKQSLISLRTYIMQETGIIIQSVDVCKMCFELKLPAKNHKLD